MHRKKFDCWIFGVINLLTAVYSLSLNERNHNNLEELLRSTANEDYDYDDGNCSEALPICPQDLDKVGFYLYTRSRHLDPYLIDPKDVLSAPFVPNVPLKFIIHGWCSHKDESPNKEIRPVLLQHSNLNVISVDWSYYARPNCYYQATKSLITVGNCTAHLIEQICKYRKDINCSELHVIGHSLGAQTAGRTGKYSKLLYDRYLPKITGLDPAAPLFNRYFYDGFAINKTDGQEVQIIHTNAHYAGKEDQCGTADFFVNGGTYQHGCTNFVCSHLRAADYYAESIFSRTGFWGYPCSIQKYHYRICNNATDNQFVLMGYNMKKGLTGVYFVDTAALPPFARGKVEDATEKKRKN